MPKGSRGAESRAVGGDDLLPYAAGGADRLCRERGWLGDSRSGGRNCQGGGGWMNCRWK